MNTKLYGPIPFGIAIRMLHDLRAYPVIMHCRDDGEYLEIPDDVVSALMPLPQPAPILPFTPGNGNTRQGAWPGTYTEYTSTSEFAKIAAEAKKAWGYHCLLNQKHAGPVEMHHRTYAHVPFGEDWRDLIPLCEDCHRRYHGRLAKPPIGLFAEIADEQKRAA